MSEGKAANAEKSREEDEAGTREAETKAAAKALKEVKAVEEEEPKAAEIKAAAKAAAKAKACSRTSRRILHLATFSWRLHGKRSRWRQRRRGRPHWRLRLQKTRPHWRGRPILTYSLWRRTSSL